MRTTTRTAVVAALVLGLTLPAGGAALAAGGQHAQRGTAAVAAQKEKPAKQAKKPRKATVKFTAGGVVTAVAADGLTFTVKGGRDKALRDKPLTVVLGKDARVQRDDAPATLADVVVGDRVTVLGTTAAGAFTAVRVNASSAQATPTPAPTETPAPTPAPSETPTAGPTPTASAAPAL
ncbi:hypothetical protein [Kineococcus sp. NUM-3379]